MVNASKQCVECLDACVVDGWLPGQYNKRVYDVLRLLMHAKRMHCLRERKLPQICSSTSDCLLYYVYVCNVCVGCVWGCDRGVTSSAETCSRPTPTVSGQPMNLTLKYVARQTFSIVVTYCCTRIRCCRLSCSFHAVRLALGRASEFWPVKYPVPETQTGSL